MKTRSEIESELAEIEADPRLGYPLATIQVDAPLALEQLSAKSRAATLRWVLGLPLLEYHGRDGLPPSRFEVLEEGGSRYEVIEEPDA